MRVAVISRPGEPISLNIYREKILSELLSLGIIINEFSDNEEIPEIFELLWDPGLCMRELPCILKKCKIPIVGTMHGVKAFSLPVNELTYDPSEQKDLVNLKQQLILEWTWFKKKVSAVVAVSRYAALEVLNAFDLSYEKIHMIYNGIDHNIFNLASEKYNHPKLYCLHVSYDNPLKNIDRLFEAYSLLPLNSRPDLIAILPEYKKNHKINGLKIIREMQSQIGLAQYYKGAICFILPSLRETFGMPIIEAMACGCSVITSNITGCIETAGDAAHLINPRSINEIFCALKLFIDDGKIRQSYTIKRLSRAKYFSWNKSANNLLKVFESII